MKNPISYFLIIGMIFSLLWFFTSFWISFGISLLIVTVLFVRALITSQAIPISLTSKLPSAGTILMVLVVAVISLLTITWVLQGLFGFVIFAKSQTPESFNDEDLKYTWIRDCNGQFHIVNGSMLISGDVSATNTDVVWDNSIYWLDFLMKEGESVKVEVTFRNRTTERFFHFFISDSTKFRQKIKFGIGNDGLPFVSGFYSGFKDSEVDPFNLQKGDVVDVTVKFHASTSGDICPLELYEFNIG